MNDFEIEFVHFETSLYTGQRLSAIQFRLSDHTKKEEEETPYMNVVVCLNDTFAVQFCFLVVCSFVRSHYQFLFRIFFPMSCLLSRMFV